jgi:hypothetical protein
MGFTRILETFIFKHIQFTTIDTALHVYKSLGSHMYTLTLEASVLIYKNGWTKQALGTIGK